MRINTLQTPINNSPDQKVKSDYGKAKLSLVPRRIIWNIAAIREYGNNKYPEGGPDNWKKVDVQRYRDAAYRHFMYYLDDPDGVDEESKFPHLWHLACNIAFLCELEAPQTCSVSGRPYSECADCEHFRCTADEPQTDYVLSKNSDAYRFNKRMEVEEMWLNEQSGKE